MISPSGLKFLIAVLEILKDIRLKKNYGNVEKLLKLLIPIFLFGVS